MKMNRNNTENDNISLIALKEDNLRLRSQIENQSRKSNAEQNLLL